MGEGLRRHGVRPRLRHDPTAAAPAGHRAGAVRPGLVRPHAGGAVAAARAAPPAGPGGRARVRRAGRHRTGVHRLRRDLRARLVDRLPRPDSGQPVQRRLLDPRQQPGRAAAARDPQRDVRRGHGRRGREGGVQPRPARDRLPLQRRPGHRGQPRGVQDRRQGDRRPARQVDHVHGQVQRARGQLLPHPPVAARPRRQHGVLGRRARHPLGALRPLRGRHPRDHAGLHAALRTERQLLQALRRRLVRAHHARLGQRQPDLRAAPGRARGRGPPGEPPARRRREPLPRARGDGGRGPARHRARAAAGAGAEGQRLRVGQADGAPDAGRGAGRVQLLAGGPHGPGRRGRRPLHQHGGRGAERRSSPRSPTGSCAAASSASEHPHTSTEKNPPPAPRPERSTSHDRDPDPPRPQPGHRRHRRRGAARVGGGDRRRHRTRPRGVPRLAGPGPRRPGHAAAAVRRRRRRAPRGAGRPRGAQRRAHRGQRPLGGRQRARRPQLLLRRAGAALRPADPGPRRRGRHLPRAARRGRHHRAVELPHADRRLGLRAGAGGRQHRRAQARRAHPADRDPAR